MINKNTNYGLQFWQGLYPRATAASRDSKYIRFFSIGSDLHDGKWNINEFTFPIYCPWFSPAIAAVVVSGSGSRVVGTASIV